MTITAPTPLAPEVSEAEGLHARLARSLREAADFIEAHPDLPVPGDAEIVYCIPAADDKSGDDEAWRIARILGTQVTGDDSSETSLSFGPVSYAARYLSRDRMAEYSEFMQPYYEARRARSEGTEA